MSRRYPRYQGYAEGAERTLPMSFFISNLYATGEADTRLGIPSVAYTNHNEAPQSGSRESASSRSSSSILTALPQWPTPRNSAQPRLQVPPPTVPKHANRRKIGQLPFFQLSSPGNIIRQDPDPDPPEQMFAHHSNTEGKSEHRIVEEKARRRRMIVGCMITILGVLSSIGIVLGLVLGLKGGPNAPSGEQSGGPQPSTTMIPTGTTAPTPTATTTGHGGDGTSPTNTTSLSTTGQSTQSWLFWQNAQGFLSRVLLNPKSSSWTGMSNFVEARTGSPLASTFFESRWYAGRENYNFQGFQNRTSVMYLDDGNYLNEWIFTDGGSVAGQLGPLIRQKYLAHPSSKLAAYWPHIVYQGVSGELREVSYSCSSKNQCYYDRALNTTQARNGTQLLVLPVKSDLTSMAVFYQKQDGQFLEYREDNAGVTTVLQSPSFSELIPINASVAGFSTVRPQDANNPNLNVYLLWQDSSNVIQLSYTDDTNVWKGPNTDPTFAGADNHTALSCVSGVTFSGFPLQRTPVLARCYFQTGMALREVSFDGGFWNITGVVSLDI